MACHGMGALRDSGIRSEWCFSENTPDPSSAGAGGTGPPGTEITNTATGFTARMFPELPIHRRALPQVFYPLRAAPASEGNYDLRTLISLQKAAISTCFRRPGIAVSIQKAGKMKNVMTAARLSSQEKSLNLVNVDVPHPGSGEVLVRVKCAGICLTDIHFIDGEVPEGMPGELTLGHEVSGVIEIIGDNTVGWSEGDRVVIHPVSIRADGSARVMGAQYDGGWADYVVCSADQLVAIGADIPFDVASIIPDAVSTPWAAITDTAHVRAGEAAAVWGLGGLGYHAIQLLRLVGAVPIIGVDPLETARKRALRAGADFALDPRDPDFIEQMRKVTDERGVAVAFDSFGSPQAQSQAFDALARGGRLVLIGMSQAPLGIEAHKLIRSAKGIIGHYGSEKRHVEEIVQLVRLGRLDLTGSITEILPLAAAQVGLDHLRSKDGNPIRILLQP